jgi:hypothetical protein
MINVGYYVRPEGNFGDDLSPAIISHLLNEKVQSSSYLDAEILGIGSILQHWKNRKRKYRRNLYDIIYKKKPIAIWGTGLIAPRKVFLPKADILALRGPLTAKYLGLKESVIYGDPGILARDIVPTEKKTGVIGIIPHYFHKDNEVFLQISKLPNFMVIDVENNYTQVLKEISRCDLILSSSLHGLICADSYGIPNARITVSNELIGGDFKFNDYCLGVGRDLMQENFIKTQSDILITIEKLEKQPTVLCADKLNDASKQLKQTLYDWNNEGV